MGNIQVYSGHQEVYLVYTSYFIFIYPRDLRTQSDTQVTNR